MSVLRVWPVLWFPSKNVKYNSSICEHFCISHDDCDKEAKPVNNCNAWFHKPPSQNCFLSDTSMFLWSVLWSIFKWEILYHYILATASSYVNVINAVAKMHIQLVVGVLCGLETSPFMIELERNLNFRAQFHHVMISSVAGALRSRGGRRRAGKRFSIYVIWLIGDNWA